MSVHLEVKFPVGILQNVVFELFTASLWFLDGSRNFQIEIMEKIKYYEQEEVNWEIEQIIKKIQENEYPNTI